MSDFLPIPESGVNISLWVIENEPIIWVYQSAGAPIDLTSATFELDVRWSDDAGGMLFRSVDAGELRILTQSGSSLGMLMLQMSDASRDKLPTNYAAKYTLVRTMAGYRTQDLYGPFQAKRWLEKRGG